MPDRGWDQDRALEARSGGSLEVGAPRWPGDLRRRAPARRAALGLSGLLLVAWLAVLITRHYSPVPAGAAAAVTGADAAEGQDVAKPLPPGLPSARGLPLAPSDGGDEGATPTIGGLAFPGQAPPPVFGAQGGSAPAAFPGPGAGGSAFTGAAGTVQAAPGSPGTPPGTGAGPPALFTVSPGPAMATLPAAGAMSGPGLVAPTPATLPARPPGRPR